jgi:hypothetical protein
MFSNFSLKTLSAMRDKKMESTVSFYFSLKVERLISAMEQEKNFLLA